MRPFLHTSTTAKAVALSIALYIILIYYLVKRCSRDPTSIFFDARIGYSAEYSEVRKQEAETFISHLEHTPFRRLPTEDKPFLCLGIPTISRSTDQYLPYTVGSLFHGLRDIERQEILFLVFIAQTEPDSHPMYQKDWLHNVADRVLDYHMSDTDIDLLKQLEEDKNFRKKSLLDYIWSLEKCLESEADFVAILEDDVLALDGWYHRTKQGLQTAQVQNKLAHKEVLYLRLFYTEQYLGWNSEYWSSYVMYSCLIFLLVQAGAFILRSTRSAFQRAISKNMLVSVVFLNCAALIALFFMSGRIHFLINTPDVVEMNHHGCCGQGLVYPKSVLPDLIQWHRDKGVGFVDSLTEEFGNDRRLTRLALTPSVLQHIGSRSSKGDDHAFDRGNLSIAETIWSFGFELNDASTLSLEHQEAIH